MWNPLIQAWEYKVSEAIPQISQFVAKFNKRRHKAKTQAELHEVQKQYETQVQEAKQKFRAQWAAKQRAQGVLSAA